MANSGDERPTLTLPPHQPIRPHGALRIGRAGNSAEVTRWGHFWIDTPAAVSYT